MAAAEHPLSDKEYRDGDFSTTASESDKEKSITQLPEKQTPADVEKTADEPAVDDTTAYITGVKLTAVVVSVSLACFLTILDISVISTAIPQITDDFKSLVDVGWYGSAYNLGSAALQPLTGKIYNQFSLKWSFLVFFAVFEVGSVICGAAQSSVMLIVGRVIAGLGSSGIINGSFTIISASVPLEKRPPLIGACMGIAQLGQVIGPLIGGAFTTGYTWRWSFYINLPLGALVALPLILVHVPEQVAKQAPLKVVRQIHKFLDLVGFALFAPAVVMFLLALQYGGNQYPWRSSQVIGLFIGSGLNAIVWLVWNYYKGDDALIPVSMAKRRIVWVSSLNYGLFIAVIFGGVFYLPIYFQAIKEKSAMLSGVYILPNIGPQLFSTIMTGVLVGKVGRVPPFALFSAATIAIGAGLYGTFQPDTSTGKWIGYQILSGFGQGVGFQMPMIAVQNDIKPEHLAEATSLLVWAQYMGPTIFIVLYNTVFTTSLRSEIPKLAPNADTEAVIAAGATQFRNFVSAEDLPAVLVAYSNAIDNVFFLIAGVGAAAFFVAFFMGWKDIRPKPAPEDDFKDEPTPTVVG
ncbi:major facilitator superfamily domain-containing protein [Podospora didyma]|uniref:Major facilitator superfamily domain-containing protein n=1 Tax=Podospora didyma TaxID=330526 RepID=A0AAE0N274_9PEZI|nr:major facilitator superfamily domain-containing protein [Podospora didyma]